MTYSEIVDTFRNGLTAKFDAKCVLAGVFDRVVDAERSVAVVFNVNIHVTGVVERENTGFYLLVVGLEVCDRIYLPDVPRMRQVTAPLPAFLALTEMQYSSPIDSVCWIPSVILQLSA